MYIGNNAAASPKKLFVGCVEDEWLAVSGRLSAIMGPLCQTKSKLPTRLSLPVNLIEKTKTMMLISK